MYEALSYYSARLYRPPMLELPELRLLKIEKKTNEKKIALACIGHPCLSFPSSVSLKLEKKMKKKSLACIGQPCLSFPSSDSSTTFAPLAAPVAYVSIRQQHTSAYVSIRQHTSAYVSIRQHTVALTRAPHSPRSQRLY